MTDKWVQLAELANLAFDHKLAKLSELRAAEGKLTEQRRRLEGMNEQALVDLSEPHPSHWQNGDFHWQRWLAKNARALSIEQARLRVLSEMHKPELRKAFGRKTVMESLAKKETR